MAKPKRVRSPRQVGGDADHRAGGVDERAARPRRLDRRVGLDQPVERLVAGVEALARAALITPVDTAGSPSRVVPMATVAAPGLEVVGAAEHRDGEAVGVDA